MAKFYEQLTPALTEFLEAQHVYFVASATADSRINLSPKGLDTLRVIDEKTVRYLDLTGSGNETAAHLVHDGRLTLMTCAFVGKPKILRLYGRGRVINRSSPEWNDAIAAFPDYDNARQVIELAIETLQTSCGFGVPNLVHQSDRDEMVQWSERKGPEGVRKYWRDRNAESIDGLEAPSPE
ncbi:MAG: pyridoxamine 5'-phosphate oxidase family protein [Planctomycetota bacterium]